MPGTPDPEPTPLHRGVNGPMRAQPMRVPPSLPHLPVTSTLPMSLHRLIGRELELAALTELLGAPSVRLLTLTGPGGCGKTQLALAAAGAMAGTFADGARWVDLAGLADPSLVPQAVAATLGIREQPGRRLAETLPELLSSRQLLLAMDNCEHLIHACATFAAHLLSVCPQVRILATSREALGLIGETVWSVPSLPAPDPGQLPSFEELAGYASVQLFVARAVAVRSSFELTDLNAEAVAHICARLDGLPLALELAAARVKHLTPHQIAARLDDRFALLTTGSRVAPVRQQTLKATLGWSYDLLQPSEQTLFRRLSVFAGSWTLAAAEVVCSDHQLGQGEILDLLARLIDRSLVVMQPQRDEARYRQLETIRQYGTELLRKAGETEAMRRRHAALFLAVAIAALPERDDLAAREELSTSSLRRLEAERDNLRAALDWSLVSASNDDVRAGLQAAAALMRFWEMHNDLREGSERLTAFLRHPASAPRTIVRAKAALAAGRLAYAHGDHQAGRDWLLEGLTIFRELDDQRGIAASLTHLAHSGWRHPDYPTERSLHEASLAIYRSLGDTWGIAISLIFMANHLVSLSETNRVELAREGLALFLELGSIEGIVFARYVLVKAALLAGDYVSATVLTEETVALLPELEDQHDVIWTQLQQGDLALALGDVNRARAVYDRTQALARTAGLTGAVAWSLKRLGEVALVEGNYARAREQIEQSLLLFEGLDDQLGLTEGLRSLAEVACGQAQRGHDQRLSAWATRLFGAADALHSAGGFQMPVYQQIQYERAVSATRARLDAGQFAALWAEGQAMPMQEALTYARTEQPVPRDDLDGRAPSHVPARPRRELADDLTRREREVATLIAEGKSNRAIAAELIVTVRAVEANVTRILAKLGLNSRVQIALWASGAELAPSASRTNTSTP